MNRSLLLALAAALATQSTLVAGEPLGRLFFTPERRAAMERQRQLNIEQTRTLQGSTMRLDGIVRRSSGRSTVWINGQAEHENSNAAGVNAVLPSHHPGKAILGAGEEPPAELRVGETINRATRETQDVLGGGRIVAEPAGR